MQRLRDASIFLLLLPGACGDDHGGMSASFASEPSASDVSAGTASETGATTVPPTGSTSAASAEPTITSGDEVPTTGAATQTTDTSATSETSATTDDTSADSTTGAISSGPDDTTAGETIGCPEGQDGCPCGAGDVCDAGLMCTQGICGPAAKCGDGKIDVGEQCDDGAGNGDTKACKSNCSEQICGDGFIGPNEACDDGNKINGDGCEASCVVTQVAQDACKFDGDGVWFQIDYESAFSVSNPAYTYSPTPNWQEPQWAPMDKGYPYAVDLFNNAKVIEDQIGTVALLDGTNKAVRVYFGLVGLSSYSHATVCVEGRSYSVGSSVTFTVTEAKTKCGATGMVSNSWEVHAGGVDMADCFLPGDGFQAVQVQPSGGSGSLSLKRLRVTLHGAVY